LRADFLAIDIEGQVVRLPVHTVGVVARWVGHLAVDLAVGLPRYTGGLRISGVDRAVDPRIVVPVVLNDVELLPSARVVRGRLLLGGLHPECIPGIRIVREISPDLEVAVCLREVALCGDQARLPAAGIARCGRAGLRGGDRKRPVLNAEWIVAGPGVDERGFPEADVGVGVKAPLRTDISIGGASAGLRDAAGIKLVVEG